MSVLMSNQTTLFYAQCTILSRNEVRTSYLVRFVEFPPASSEDNGQGLLANLVFLIYTCMY